MATYNGAPFLAQQIDSILAQMQRDDELLVSDDASTDSTVAILDGYGNALSLVARDRAGGVVRNFARVLSHASRPLIVLADQDDVWLEGRLARMREALTRSELVLVNALVTDERLEPTGATVFQEVRAAKGFWRNVSRRNSFVGCCMGFRRSLLHKALPFPFGTPWHDWLIGLLACIGGRIELVDTPMLLYRRHASNASLTGRRSVNSPWRMLKIRVRILFSVFVCLVRAKLR